MTYDLNTLPAALRREKRESNLMTYGETVYEKGVLYGLEHDVPALRAALGAAIDKALGNINKGPSHFTDGRRYPLNRLQDAVEQAINALHEETTQTGQSPA